MTDVREIVAADRRELADRCARQDAHGLDWSLGSGQQELTGNAQDLLLVLCGRKLPPGRVSGAPSSRFTTA